jgi:plasmid stabilization system protein ParE
MARITLRPQAAVDILDIWHYIAEDSIDQADRGVAARGPLPVRHWVSITRA